MRRLLFVDGSNLYGGLDQILKPGEYINFKNLLKIIEEDIDFDKICFYATYMQVKPNSSKSYQLRVRAQKAFFDSAKSVRKLDLIKGHFSGSGKEKGVDVMLAVDMVTGAFMDKYDEAAIMTGDADLKYAVETTNKIGKKIHLVAIGSRFPFGILKYTTRRYVYDINNYFEKNVLPLNNRLAKQVKINNITEKVNILRVGLN